VHYHLNHTPSPFYFSLFLSEPDLGHKPHTYTFHVTGNGGVHIMPSLFFQIVLLFSQANLELEFSYLHCLCSWDFGCVLPLLTFETKISIQKRICGEITNCLACFLNFLL
jgi:hypothetical protein